MKEHYHFIGIGGVGMSALVHIALQKGHSVSGSDIKKSDVTESLKDKGAHISYGHIEGVVKQGYTVVYNSMIHQQNPEFIDALRYGCNILHRSDLLQAFLHNKRAIVVAGSHGKTTTSALLSHVLTQSNAFPSYVVGGFSPSLPTNGLWGEGDIFVAEGDESDGSFLKTSPYGAIITNIDYDHLSYWKTKSALIKGFEKFIKSIINETIYNGDDQELISMGVQGVSFGLSPEVDYRAVHIQMRDQKTFFDIVTSTGTYYEVESSLWGIYNVRNALGVFAMAERLGCTENQIRKALSSFKGVKRRLEWRGEIAGITHYDDYAHHPSEIREVYKTLLQMRGDKRLVIVFEPHRFSRTEELFPEFVETLQAIDGLILTDIYPAGEKPIEGVSSKRLFEAMRGENIEYVPKDRLTQHLSNHLREGDLLITLGAGNITELSLEQLGCAL